METKTSGIRQALPQVIAVSVKNILLVGFGMTLGFPTILIPSLSGGNPNEKISLGQEAISWIGSVNLICVPLGGILSGSATHAFGRKRTMQLVNIPFLTAWLIFHFAREPWQIFTALCLTGLTGGLLEAPVLTYVAEITQPHLRGLLSSTSTMSVSAGLLTQFILGTFLEWRTVAMLNCCIPLLSFTALMFIPESPIWLISKNRLQQAKESIAWLRGWTTTTNIEDEFQELYKQIHVINPGVKILTKRRTFNTDRMKLLLKKDFIWPFSLVSFSFLLCHNNGNTTLVTYAIKIFSTLDVPIDKYYATILMGCLQLIGCLVCISFINFLGKRLINYISLVGTAICFLIVAIYAHLNNFKYLDGVTLNEISLQSNFSNVTTGSPEPLHTWIPVTFLSISAFLSYVGIKILPWILTGEVFSNEARATASGLSSAVGYIFGFLVNKAFLSMVSHLTLPGVFWLNSFIGLSGAVILYFVLPETEGKTLHEITEHFSGKNKMNNNVKRRSLDDLHRSHPLLKNDKIIKEESCL